MSDPVEQFASGMDKLRLMAEAVVGYRQVLIDGGVSGEMADTMSKDFHDVLLAQAVLGMDTARRGRR